MESVGLVEEILLAPWTSTNLLNTLTQLETNSVKSL